MKKLIRILAVDDQEEILNLLKWGLEKHLSCRVEVAENGLEALKLLRARQYDLVITDLNMPRMGGREFVVKSREELGLELPIIILSTQARELTDIERFNVLLASKPVDIRAFSELTQHLVED